MTYLPHISSHSELTLQALKYDAADSMDLIKVAAKIIPDTFNETQ